MLGMVVEWWWAGLATLGRLGSPAEGPDGHF